MLRVVGEVGQKGLSDGPVNWIPNLIAVIKAVANRIQYCLSVLYQLCALLDSPHLE